MLFAATATLFLLLCPLGNSEVDLSPIAATCNPATLNKIYQSTNYIQLVSSHDPEVVFGWRVPSDVAAEGLYDLALRLLQEYGLSNAESIASTFKDAVSQRDTFTIAEYYFGTATAAGKFTTEKGVLNCDNVISRATQFSEAEQSEFQNLDPNQLESYLQSVLFAINNRLNTVEYILQDKGQNWQRFADLFYTVYSNYAT